MWCAYLTLDEVNQDLAQRLAAAAGVRLEVLSLRDAAPAGQFEAVLYDLDFLPPDCREALLADLRAQRWIEPVAVHSYQLSPRQIVALRRSGVIVARRLGRKVFDRLLAAVSARRASPVER
jgi:hypothetical protein